MVRITYYRGPPVVLSFRRACVASRLNAQQPNSGDQLSLHKRQTGKGTQCLSYEQFRIVVP